MLIVDDSKPLPEVQPDVTVMRAHIDSKQGPVDSDEPLPPPYTPTPDGASTSASPQAPSYTAAPSPSTFTSASSSIPPSKFVSVTRKNNAITGTWAIDPTLPSLPGVAQPMSDVYIQSMNGRIAAEVTVVAHAARDITQKTKMDLKTTNGAVKLTVHAPERYKRTPLYLAEHTTNGAVTLILPRSFVGPLTASTTNGRVKLSDGIARSARDVQEGQRETKCMIGMGNGAGKDGLSLDEAIIETTNGGVNVAFDDEEVPSAKGFLTKLFGM
ncbi:uncharacterized protein SCHCODRAFT_02603973 [Schizophyllum commune H4-8]|uniref:Expressed protein n=1 Tax=Schizophyllum commune (strain H4-8 / FGSC 9210) TaxID=578458 RepID=D8PUQ1_SCHCM|nr:uncharacterized protein SCHCODRAFT_02603973 [Schizophyllum commune H4-8]KAI5899026.1 hypothetical protein SCHCODRAFT_02603973 [Schizophyllum commune H4-8]